MSSTKRNFREQFVKKEKMSSTKRIFKEQFCKKNFTKKYFRQKDFSENNL